MSKFKYTLNDNYIELKYKASTADIQSNSRGAPVAGINVDPKIRLAALMKLSDGSDYFKQKINEIEKSIDSSRINLSTINDEEQSKLKAHLTNNMETELSLNTLTHEYLLNLFHLFYSMKWNDLINKLLNITIKYCKDIDDHIQFAIDLYKLLVEQSDHIIKTKWLTFLQKQNFYTLIKDSEYINEIPEIKKQQQQQPRSNLESNTKVQRGGINLNNTIDSDNDDVELDRNTEFVSDRNTDLIFNQNNFQQYNQKLEEVLIENLKVPFISNKDSPIRYIKNPNGMVSLSGIIQIGDVNSISESNQKVICELPADCYPMYKLHFFQTEDSDSNRSYFSGDSKQSHLVINTNGKISYKTKDLLNWTNNKIKIYLDGIIFFSS